MSAEPPYRPSEPSDAEERARRRALIFRRLTIGAVALTLVVMLAVAVYTVVVIRQTQKVNAPKVTRQGEQLALVKKIAERVESCTTPGEKCSRENQQQTAKIMAALDTGGKRNAAAASSCAARIPHPTFQRVYRCTLATLSRPGDQHP